MASGRNTTFTLGPEVRKPLAGCPGFYMRIDDDLRKTVVFLGIRVDARDDEKIKWGGTGFLLGYEDCGYLVTARHVASFLDDCPFVVRLNKRDGTAQNLDADHMKWYFHPDPRVDVAVILFHIGLKSDYEAVYLNESIIPSDNQIQNDAIKSLGSIGIGDITYTVGLFHFMTGQKRNLPVVHSGSIAMVPRDERIPVRDWNDKSRIITVEGYLVETQALDGLSGSPVFVRRTLDIVQLDIMRSLMQNSGEQRYLTEYFKNLTAAAPQKFVHLLGLWQSSWDAPEVMAIQLGQNVRIPLGMGVVVPAQKIIETLQHEELIEMRKKAKAERDAKATLEAATPDSAFPIARVNADNPDHKEDFTRLASAAAKKQPQDH